MAGDGKAIQVKGLKDLQGALRRIDRELPGELASGLAGVAEMVRSRAVPLIPERSGDARASVKVRRAQRGVRLAVGGGKAPYFPWLDFGGRVGRGKATLRPFIPSGRYIYPTLARHDDEIKSEVDAVLRALAARAGFDQEGRSY